MSRWPAAVRFIQERGLNEFFGEGTDDIGFIVQGGNTNTHNAALASAVPSGLTTRPCSAGLATTAKRR